MHLAVLGIILLSQLPHAQTMPVSSGRLLIVPGRNNAECLTAKSNNNGAGIALQGCIGSDSQYWKFTGGRIVVFGNQCLEVADGTETDGTELRISTCRDGDHNQQWSYNVREKRISWSNANKCINLSTGDGAPVCTILRIVTMSLRIFGKSATSPPLFLNNLRMDNMALIGGIDCSSVEDFCLWAPPSPGMIGGKERDMVALCTQLGLGTRVIVNGTLKGAHFVKTPDYVQVTGVGDFTKMNIPAGSPEVELDSGGVDGRGNPIGGLLYGKTFGSALQYHEWVSFISDQTFCFTACIGPEAASHCNHIYDEMGCNWNIPANYGAGVFESCDGDSAQPMGVYGTSTFHQGQPQTPSPHPAPSSSNCQAIPTVSSVSLNLRRGTGHLENVGRVTPTPTIVLPTI
ncbi:carbohydrate-binding module family 13 protein [Amanita thiersii Skay4041]|uniref:Carbohydrate-binding module family 13 protein n=1 Tax=Amanita thiersii Skay4041 TaxID=703135 RepID=A0A2A9NJP0_9AGAR|nr:carbohydrate-binding module family 13 protein [Amanita thiersii Skay4041]